MVEFGAVIRKGERYAQIGDRLVWVRINNATVFSSSYKAGVAIHALREQGFDVHQMVIAPVKITRIVEETEG